MNYTDKKVKFWLYSFLIFSACFLAKQSIAQEVKDYYLCSKSIIELPDGITDFPTSCSNQEQIWVVNGVLNHITLSAFSLRNDSLCSTVKYSHKLQNRGFCFGENKDLFFIGSERNTDPYELTLFSLLKTSQNGLPTDSLLLFFKRNLAEKTAANRNEKHSNRLIVSQDNLFVLSKISGEESCYFYTIESESTKQNLLPKDSLQLKGTLTGADFSPNQTTFAMSINLEGIPQLMVSEKITPNAPFSGIKKRFSLPNLAGVNITSLNFITNDTLLIVTSNNAIYRSGYFKIALSELEHATTEPLFEYTMARIVTTGRTGEILMIHKSTPIEGPTTIRLFSGKKTLIRERKIEAGEQKSQISLKIPIEMISPPYFIEIIEPERHLVRKVN